MKVALMVFFALFVYNMSSADELIAGYSASQWANAIFKAENSRKHPYGILVNYKNTTPRQACINTVKHKYKQWKQQSNGDFLPFLASKYCPIGSNTDNGTCRYWASNVQHFLTKG